VVIEMMKFATVPALLIAAGLLSGCDGLTPYRGDPNTVIATAYDTGRDKGVLTDGHAAIAYDPSGCQVWIIDDGIEGYSGRRYDPVSGLPVCDGQFPPGTVIGNYQSQSQVRVENRGLFHWIAQNVI
jgi:hypothetical protein